MARTIWDNTYADANSSAFEVIGKSIVIRAYGLSNVKATLYSLYGPQGAFFTVPYSQDLLSVLDADHNEIVVNSSGRFKLVVDDYNAAATNGVILTIDTQDVTATADVPQPSGAQANRPNTLVDTGKYPSMDTSPVIDITNEAWLFVGYGNIEVCQIVTVVGEGANEVEAPFIIDGVPVFMDADHRVLKIARSGRYRIKPYDTTFGTNVLIIGNPSTVTTEEIEAGATASGGDIANGKEILRISNTSGEDIAQGEYVHSLRGFVDNKYSVDNTGIVKADCAKRLVAHGFALEDIANGESGWVATNGANYYARIVDGIDTLTPPLPYNLGNGLFYLGTDGSLLAEPPTAGNLIQVIGGYSQEVFSAPMFSPEFMYPEIYNIVLPDITSANLNGTQYIQNSDFAAGLSDWETSSGWTAGVNSVTLDVAADANGYIKQTVDTFSTVPSLGGEGGLFVTFTVQQSNAASRTVLGIDFGDDVEQTFLLLGGAQKTFSYFVPKSKLNYYDSEGYTALRLTRISGAAGGTLTVTAFSAKAVSTVVPPYLHLDIVNSADDTMLSHVSARANKTNTLTALGSNAGALLNTEAKNNTLVGAYSGQSLQDGEENSLLGHSAGIGLQSGTKNVFVGAYAGKGIESDSNTAVGYNALSGQFLGLGIASTVAIGANALENIEDGSNNTAVGTNSGQHITAGSRNTLLGMSAGINITLSNDNVIIGYLAGSSLTTGNANTYLGTQAGQAGVTTVGNTGLGFNALFAATGAGLTAVGYQAGKALTTGVNNTAIGYNVLQAATTEANSVAIGFQAGYAAVSGTDNVNIGFNTGYFNAIGGYNTHVGSSAGYNSTASFNTYVGYQAAYAASTAANNVAVGYQAGKAITLGGNNTYLGYKAAQTNTTGNNNVAVGYQAANTLLSGTENVSLGYNAGFTNSVGNYNTNIGSQAGYAGSGTEATNVGYKAAYSATTATNAVNIGSQAGYTTTTGADNTNLGYKSGFTNATGANNTNIGSQAGYTATGSGNTNVGFKAGFAVAAAIGNTNVGYQSGKAVTGADNTNIGYNAGQALTSAANSVNVGSQAGFSGTTGAANVNVGYQAGYTGTVAASNVNIGYKAGYAGTGNTNVNIGYNAAPAATTAAGNTVIGYQAGYALTTGGNNTAVGFEAGRYQADGATALTTAVNSVYVGNGARGFSNADSNSIAVGYGAIATGANQASWGNSAITLHTFYGGAIFNEGGGDFDFRIEADTDANLFYVDATGAGLVGIGTNAPTVKLDVNSDSIRVRTTKTPASATAAGDAGTVCWDANFIYVCVAANTWKRVAIATW